MTNSKYIYFWILKSMKSSIHLLLFEWICFSFASLWGFIYKIVLFSRGKLSVFDIVTTQRYWYSDEVKSKRKLRDWKHYTRTQKHWINHWRNHICFSLGYCIACTNSTDTVTLTALMQIVHQCTRIVDCMDEFISYYIQHLYID